MNIPVVSMSWKNLSLTNHILTGMESILAEEGGFCRQKVISCFLPLSASSYDFNQPSVLPLAGAWLPRALMTCLNINPGEQFDWKLISICRLRSRQNGDRGNPHWAVVSLRPVHCTEHWLLAKPLPAEWLLACRWLQFAIGLPLAMRAECRHCVCHVWASQWGMAQQ